jgi:hypothetical protein
LFGCFVSGPSSLYEVSNMVSFAGWDKLRSIFVSRNLNR